VSSITFIKKDLASLVDHHIALLERFGITDEAPFSIIYFSLGDKKRADIVKIFQKLLRQTDALFKVEKGFVIMLPNTDWNGANDLLLGIQDFLDQKSEDSVVTFPEDGKNAKTLLKKLQELIETNCKDIAKLL